MIHFAVYETNTTFKINYIPTKVKNKNINKNKTKQPQKIFKKIKHSYVSDMPWKAHKEGQNRMTDG